MYVLNPAWPLGMEITYGEVVRITQKWVVWVPPPLKIWCIFIWKWNFRNKIWTWHFEITGPPQLLPNIYPMLLVWATTQYQSPDPHSENGLKECKEHNWGILHLPPTSGGVHATNILMWSGFGLYTNASQIFWALSQLPLWRVNTPDELRHDYWEASSAPLSGRRGCG